MSYAGLNKKVFDKMPKQEVELSSEVVELSMVDEIEKLYKTARNSFSDATKITESIRPLISKAEKAWSEAGKNFLKVSSEVSKLDKKAKELGVKVPAEIDKRANDAGEAFERISKRLRVIRSIENEL